MLEHRLGLESIQSYEDAKLLKLPVDWGLGKWGSFQTSDDHAVLVFTRVENSLFLRQTQHTPGYILCIRPWAL